MQPRPTRPAERPRLASTHRQDRDKAIGQTGEQIGDGPEWIVLSPPKQLRRDQHRAHAERIHNLQYRRIVIEVGVTDHNHIDTADAQAVHRGNDQSAPRIEVVTGAGIEDDGAAPAANQITRTIADGEHVDSESRSSSQRQHRPQQPDHEHCRGDPLHTPFAPPRAHHPPIHPNQREHRPHGSRIRHADRRPRHRVDRLDDGDQHFSADREQHAQQQRRAGEQDRQQHLDIAHG